MKRKQNHTEKDPDIRRPSIPQDAILGPIFPVDMNAAGHDPEDASVDNGMDTVETEDISVDTIRMSGDYRESFESVSETQPLPSSVVLDLGSHKTDIDLDDTDDSDDSDSSVPSRIRKTRTHTLYEPRSKKKRWIKPLHFLIPMLIIALIIGVLTFVQLGSLEERFASPLTVRGESVSNAEFSFVYHYILLENGVNIFETGTNESLSGPGENGYATLREYFLDMAARELQVTQILNDDALSKGYKVTDANRAMAQAYVDWLSGKASEIGVSLDEYIKGYFGQFVTKELILDNLTKRYFTEDYANGPKLEELKASPEQAEDAYASNPYQYDLVSYHVLRIVYEQTDDSFKATAHLHAQEIIDGIGHDPAKFESVAAGFFTGDARDKILQPDSTLISNVRYANQDNIEWRTWLFDPARQPGDCTIFDDADGFPILLCFTARTRQVEPLRDVRFFYINREDTVNNQPGISAGEIMPTAQAMFDSVSDESTMKSLETTYADNINANQMKAEHKADTFKGELAADLDSWVFDPARVPGDKTLIETDTQVVIVYYVAASPNPEWFDRVNSFIRMNNYQAFLLEKQVEYPYVFNSNGLSKIYDISP